MKNIKKMFLICLVLTIMIIASSVYAEKNIEDLIILVNPIEYDYDGTPKKPTVSIYDNSVIVATFNANGGACAISTKAVKNGSLYGTLPNATRPGFTFNGWYDAETGGNRIQSSTVVTRTTSHTLYAHWTEN